MLLNLLLYVLLALSLLAKGFALASSKKRGAATGFGSSQSTAWKKHTSDDSDSTTRLLHFLKSNKAELSNVKIGFSNVLNRRGLYAVKNVGNGKTICKVPSDCALALSDPSQPPCLSLAQNAAFFLQRYWDDPQARQLWSFYLETLPKEPDETPDFFEEDEIQLLEWPLLMQHARERQVEIQRVSQEYDLDADQLHFATWLVSSRSFTIQLSESGQETEVLRDGFGQASSPGGERKYLHVLVPFLDMANHASDANARLTVLDPEKDEAWFALQATRPISPGKEIRIAYGNGLDTSELFMNYGFAPDENPVDKLVLQKGQNILVKDDWSTTLDEDKAMLAMLDDDIRLEKILRFRIKMKEAYK